MHPPLYACARSWISIVIAPLPFLRFFVWLLSLSLHTLNHHCIRLQALLPLLTDTMAVAKKAPKGATLEDEKKKLLQQYKNDDGHFSLVR